MWTKTSTHTLCEPAKWKCIWRFHKSHLIQKFAGKTLRNRGGKHTLCERAQWKCICTWRFYKSHFIRKFTSKMPRTTSCGPRPRHTLCVSLRSSNALGDFTRATFYRNLQVKCRGPEPGRTLCASRNALGDFTKPPYTEIYKWNARAQLEHPDQVIKHRPLLLPQGPSVWTHCLGNRISKSTRGLPIF